MCAPGTCKKARPRMEGKEANGGQRAHLPGATQTAQRPAGLELWWGKEELIKEAPNFGIY